MNDDTGERQNISPANEMPEEEILRQRKEKLKRLKEEEGYDPYEVDRWDREHFISFVLDRYANLDVNEPSSENLSVAGRIMTLRRHGKAAFANLADESGQIQLYFQHDALGDDQYSFFKKWVDAGDILGVRGNAFRTQRGELSIKVSDFSLLSKSLRPLPEK